MDRPRHETWIQPGALRRRGTLEHLLALPGRAHLSRRSPRAPSSPTSSPTSTDGPFAEAVGRLCAYRGVTEIGALTLSAEVCDWRRFARRRRSWASAGSCPREYSSGERVERGRITKAGNTHLRSQLVESAWAYQHRPAVGPTHEEAPGALLAPRPSPGPGAPSSISVGSSAAWPQRKTSRKIVATAIARELAGFFWGEMAA